MSESFGKGKFELFLDDKKLREGLDKVESRLRGFANGARAIGSAFATIGGIATVALGSTIKAASDAEEALNKFQAIFKGVEKDAGKFADTLASKTGRSALMLKDSMAELQGVMTGYGLSQEEALKLTKQLAAAGVDAASIHNKADGDVMHDFASAVSGSSETVQKYGINIKEAMVKARLAEQGVDGLTGAALEQAKVMAKVEIIMETLAKQNVLGDAERTAGSTANQLKRLNAEVERAKISVGSALLPAVNKLLPEIVKIAESFGKWASENPELILTVGKLAIGVTALGGGLLGASIAANQVAGAIAVVKTAMVAAGGPAALFSAGSPLLIGLGLVAAAVVTLSDAWSKHNAEMERAKKLSDQFARDRNADLQKRISEARGAEQNFKGAGKDMLVDERQRIRARLDSMWDRHEKDKRSASRGVTGRSAAERDQIQTNLEWQAQQIANYEEQLRILNKELEDIGSVHDDYVKKIQEENDAKKEAALAAEQAKRKEEEAAKSAGEKFLEQVDMMSSFTSPEELKKFIDGQGEKSDRSALVEQWANAGPGQLAGLIGQMTEGRKQTFEAAGRNYATESGSANAQAAIQEALGGRFSKQDKQTDLIQELRDLLKEVRDYKENEKRKEEENSPEEGEV